MQYESKSHILHPVASGDNHWGLQAVPLVPTTTNRCPFVCRAAQWACRVLATSPFCCVDASEAAAVAAAAAAAAMTQTLDRLRAAKT